MTVDKCAPFSDELVERYSLGRLSGPECAAFEEHLLLCEACQERLRASDEYVAAVRAAGAQLARRGPARAATAGGSGFFRKTVGSRVTLAAAAAVMGGFSLFLWWQPAPAIRGTSRVALASLRGGTDASIHHVARARRLILEMDTSRLPASCDCRLQVVDDDGHPVWEQRVRVDGPAVSVEIGRALAAGRYWVRLYGSDLSEDPWREYGFEVD
jgi:anti-sigma factor RsiW